MITENFNAYSDGGSHKEFSIAVSGTDRVITNEKLLQESIKLDEALCSDQNLRYGSCEASQLTLQVANSDIDFKDKTLTVTVTMDGISTEYGTFKVQSDKPTADRIWRVLTAYDAMYDIINADVSAWYKTLTFPMTIKAFRDSFFTNLGITQKNATLINDSFETEGGFSATGALSCVSFSGSSSVSQRSRLASTSEDSDDTSDLTGIPVSGFRRFLRWAFIPVYVS